MRCITPQNRKQKTRLKCRNCDLPQSCCLHGREEGRVANGYVDAVGFQEALGTVKAFGAELVIAEGTK
jgi:hypothetical protein